MKKCYLLLFLLLPSMVMAYEITEIDGINYYLNESDKTAEVAEGYYSGYVKIPNIVTYNSINYSVTSIGKAAFSESYARNDRLTAVNIPNSITSIGSSAFYGCTELTSIVIPNSVTSIGEKALSGTGITSIELPNSLTVINERLFEGCSRLSSVTIPNSVVSINRNAFEGCGKLNSIIIPNSVTSIGNAAFYHCDGLESVTIPSSVTSIGNAAFSLCYALTSVHISDIASWCAIDFGNGNNPLYIAHHLYENSVEIKDLVIPNSVTKINSYAFIGCEDFLSISIPNSVKSIGESAFRDCSGFTSITIPKSVTQIGAYAFAGCKSTKTLVIPNSITRLQTQVFSKLTNLTDVYCYIEDVPNTDSDVFSGSSIENATLHVPNASINNYKTISPWSKFGKIIGIDGDEGSESKKCATPTISYFNGKLSFNCQTDGVTYKSTITDSDISTYSSNEIQLGVTYDISVYATKDGYESSDIVTATLCWIDADPKTEGVNNGIAQVRSNAVLIRTENSNVNIIGVDDGIKVSVFGINGQQIGSAISHNGNVNITTNLKPGNIVVIKIGEKSVKTTIK